MSIRPHTLPAELTSFIGRSLERAEARNQLRGARILTLVGSAGSGKTRLAIRLAADVAETFADGVCFVELSGVSTPALVQEITAMTLGVRPQSGQTLTASLVDHLATRRLLLVIDNCEHVVETAARMIETVVGGTANLTILATSREPLRINGERLMRVQPLACPSALQLLPLDELAKVDAVALFLDRARFHDPSFTLTPENAHAVAEVCRRLDGIPLALELAAARMAALGVEQLSARLDDAIQFLDGGSRTIARQETLKATLDWSYALLSPSEQRLLRQLSLFAGSFDVEAAEAVCSGPDLETVNVLSVVANLVEKSLVQVTAADGIMRYRLLEMVRQYARTHLLRNSDAGAVQERYATYYLNLAERAEPGLKGSDAVTWLNRIEHDYDNLRSALAWFEQTHQIDLALRLAAALHQYLLVRGYHRDGRALLTRVLALPTPVPSARARTKALMALGELLLEEADYPAARSVFGEALSVFEGLADQGGQAYAWWYLGRVLRRSGDNAGSRALFERSVQLFRASGDERGLAGALMTLGDCLANLQEMTLARSVLEESLALFHRLGGAGAPASVAWVFGNLACDEGNYEEARALFTEALATGSRLADKSMIAQALEGFAGLAGLQKQAIRAFRLAGAASALRRAIGAPLPPQWQSELDRRLYPVTLLLDEAGRGAQFQEGASWPLQTAMAYARQTRERAALGPLTARERDVALLVARGLTNRQIADTLVISPETAALHVKHILAKLDFHSRSQLIAWVATQPRDAATPNTWTEITTHPAP